MSGYLIDTIVISEYTKPEPSAQVIRWFESSYPDHLFASVITLGEIQLVIKNMPVGKKRAELEQWVKRGLPAWFQSNLLPVTGAISERWATLTVRAKRHGFQLDIADGLIAATALEHELTIVTRNVKDFHDLGVEILNPWEG